ncbi:MAG TPA: S-adenosylmethionine decarboxylase proenzyme [Elusimicrobia bacterium]|jgi:S-adenosylmethionine decarboxylase|nr:S-adenosylmethionine decarboxylase proenzyme [Elusimicrobiota bacterium]
MKSLGRHLLIELYGCEEKILNSVSKVEVIMTEATKACGAQIIDVIFHRFNPHGVSGVVVIAESHFAIHTWPEYGFASIDLYTCGEEIDPWKAHQYLVKKLKPKNSTVLEMRRGILGLPPERIKHKP